jgi:hypothetical protein
MDPQAAAALEAFRIALAKSQGRRPAFLQLLWPDGKIDTYSLDGMMPAAGPDAKGEPVKPPLSDREKAVLAVLAKAERPMKGCTVATRAGLKYNSHFRDVMSELKEKRLVIVDGDRRYWPADRPAPGGAD